MFRKLIIASKIGSFEIGHNVPFILQKLEGLGVPDNNSITIKSSRQDGVSYEYSLLDERIIDIEFGILTDSFARQFELREFVNRILNPHNLLEIIYEYPGGIKKIKGYIKGDIVFPESDLLGFQKVICSVACPNPYWNDIFDTSEEIATWQGSFQFPLEIKSEGIEMGVRLSNLIAKINNRGAVETGIKIIFKATGEVNNPSLFNVETREFIRINKTMQVGEELIITTEVGNKKVFFTKNGITSNGFVWLDDESTFIKLMPGKNIFRYDAEEGLDNLEVTIIYNQKYVGV